MSFGLEAAGDGLDRADLVAVEIVGLGERRERVGHALAVRLVAGLAIVGEHAARRCSMRSALVAGGRRRNAALPGDPDPGALRLVDEIELLAGIDELVLRRLRP